MRGVFASLEGDVDAVNFEAVLVVVHVRIQGGIGAHVRREKRRNCEYKRLVGIRSLCRTTAYKF